MGSTDEAQQRADGVDSEIGRFEELIGDLEQARDDVYDAYNNLVQAWEDSWGWWKRNVFSRGDYAEEREALDGIWEKIEETKMDREGVTGSVLELTQQVLRHNFSVISLFRMSGRWVTDTYSPTSDVYGDVAMPEHARDLADWEGPARTAYDDIVDHQNNAVGAMRDVAHDISIWLSDVATGNVEFLVDLVSELGGLANSLISEAGKIANTAGIGVIWGVAEAIGTVVETAINVLGTFITNLAAMAENRIQADRIILDHSYFPEGNWPEAVSRA